MVQMFMKCRTESRGSAAPRRRSASLPVVEFARQSSFHIQDLQAPDAPVVHDLDDRSILPRFLGGRNAFIIGQPNPKRHCGSS